MTQSFDEWYLPKKHFLDDCESGYFECYEAGAASRQAEVSKLRTEIDGLKSIITKQQIQMLQIQQSCSGCDSRDLLIDHLQKRIDDALKELELIDYFRTGNSDKAIKILKGESNE